MGRKFFSRLVWSKWESNRHSQSLFEEPVGRDHSVALLIIDRLPPEFAPSAFENQASGGDVPKANALFDIGIEQAHCDIRQSKGGRAHHSNLPDSPGQSVEIRQRF